MLRAAVSPYNRHAQRFSQSRSRRFETHRALAACVGQPPWLSKCVASGSVKDFSCARPSPLSPIDQARWLRNGRCSWFRALLPRREKAGFPEHHAPSARGPDRAVLAVQFRPPPRHSWATPTCHPPALVVACICYAHTQSHMSSDMVARAGVIPPRLRMPRTSGETEHSDRAT